MNNTVKKTILLRKLLQAIRNGFLIPNGPENAEYIAALLKDSEKIIEIDGGAGNIIREG